MPKVVLFNKPFNVLSQFTDRDETRAKDRQTLADYLEIPGIYPAGRLDRDSEGLLVLTDSGALQQKLSHPKNKVSKTYWAQVEGVPTEAHLDRLRQGLELKDGMTAPAKCGLISAPDVWPRDPPIRSRKTVPTQWITLTIAEGRNRQVRRMCATAGFPVLRLIRYRVGSWTIDGLAPGEYSLL